MFVYTIQLVVKPFDNRLYRLYRVNGALITWPAGAAAKYCDEYVCLSVCLSVHEDISRTM